MDENNTANPANKSISSLPDSEDKYSFHFVETIQENSTVDSLKDYYKATGVNNLLIFILIVGAILFIFSIIWRSTILAMIVASLYTYLLICFFSMKRQMRVAKDEFNVFFMGVPYVCKDEIENDCIVCHNRKVETLRIPISAFQKGVLTDKYLFLSVKDILFTFKLDCMTKGNYNDLVEYVKSKNNITLTIKK